MNIRERREGKREENRCTRDAEVNMISLICMWGLWAQNFQLLKYTSLACWRTPLGRRTIPTVCRRFVGRMVNVETSSSGRMMVKLRLLAQTSRGVGRGSVQCAWMNGSRIYLRLQRQWLRWLVLMA